MPKQDKTGRITRKTHALDKTVIQAHVPRYVKYGMEDYVAAFNRDHPGARMSSSRLTASLVIKFLKEEGAIDESPY